MTTSLVVVCLVAQSPAPGAPTAPDLQRIRKALEKPAPIVLDSPVDRRDGPVFRMKIERFRLPDAWQDRSWVPAYVRPSMPIYHYEFLGQVTPEEFRAGSLHPGALGLPIVPLAQFITRHAKAARRAAQQERARQEVRAAIALFLACQADATRPACAKH